MIKHRIDPPGDVIDKTIEGCGNGCVFVVVVLWLASFFLLIYGAAGCVKLFSR